MTVKRITELTKKDLTDHPIWKYWTENNIELVSESKDNLLSEYSPDIYIVLTEFVLNNGSKVIGFCSPQDPSGLDYIQPVLLTDNGQVNMYHDKGWDNKTEQIMLAKIGLTKQDIFPIVVFPFFSANQK